MTAASAGLTSPSPPPSHTFTRTAPSSSSPPRAVARTGRPRARRPGLRRVAVIPPRIDGAAATPVDIDPGASWCAAPYL